MQDYYNMNQTTLSIALDYQPEEHHPARYINQLVESLKLKYDYQFGRPREYNLGAMLKLVLLAYCYGIFSSRKIEQFARENKPAGWLIVGEIPAGSELTPELLDIMISKVEDHLVVLNETVEATKQVSPNPAKQQRRTVKSQKRKLDKRCDKMREHQAQQAIYGQRNSYSKTDHDATFMRVKEDPMQNGQLKPAYNVQIATSNQFITGYRLFPNPTDTRTLQPFIEHLKANNVLGHTIVADAGYGSESNYRYLEDEFGQHTVLIPYGTMLKENSRKWQSDDRKVMNWDYHEKDDYFINPQNVRFNFNAYRQRTDKYGFTRDFKEYIAEKYDENHQLIPAALTPKGYFKRISVNEN